MLSGAGKAPPAETWRNLNLRLPSAALSWAMLDRTLAGFPITGPSRRPRGTPRVYSLAHPGVPAGPSDSEALRLNAKFLRNAIVMLVLVVGTVALLYTWVQSSTPATTVGYLQFLDDVKAGKVTTVVQDGEDLTVTTTGGTYTVDRPQLHHGRRRPRTCWRLRRRRADVQRRTPTSASPPRTRRGSRCC